jgi:hypothetical protein
MTRTRIGLGLLLALALAVAGCGGGNERDGVVSLSGADKTTTNANHGRDSKLAAELN